MKNIPDGSVDLILTDPPYGTTACKWDSIIPLEPMWEQLKRIIKPNGAIVLFCGEPFTSILVVSNMQGFKYRMDWDKKIPSGMGYARFRPMQQTEDILIFTKIGERTQYNPQKTKRANPIKSGGTKPSESAPIANKCPNFKKTYDFKNPITLIQFDKIRRGSLHPTQKPVDLMEYLIKTYTNEGETVLDFTMGSGSTGIACMNTKRGFIGIEKDDDYFAIASKRMEDHNDFMAQQLF
jgi:site-specific DNA-methyltransferase (adenine-specific)